LILKLSHMISCSFSLNVLCTPVIEVFMLYELRIIMLSCISDYKRGSDWQLDLLDSCNS
jgi:hypothetical protein